MLPIETIDLLYMFRMNKMGVVVWSFRGRE